MTSPLRREDVERLRQKLQERQRALRTAVAEALERDGDERNVALAGPVRDAGDEAVAELLVDLGLAGLEQECAELRDIEAAVQRMRAGTYGICTDCGDEIPLPRLEAWPTSRRCVTCQSVYERQYRPPGSRL